MTETTKHEGWIDFSLRVPIRDGVELSANVCRPIESKAGARSPAILVRTPHNKNTQKMLETGRWFSERGYAVVAMDARVRGDLDTHLKCSSKGTALAWRSHPAPFPSMTAT